MPYELNLKQYDAFVEAHPEGSFFHKSVWLENLRHVLGKQYYVLTHRDEDEKIVGGLPLSMCRGFRGKALVSVPFRDYGGFVVEDASIAANLLQEAKDVAQETGADRVSIHRLSREHTDMLRDAGFTEALYGIDSRLDLSMTDGDYWAALESPVRRAVKKSIKCGISVERGDSALCVAKFYKLFLATRKRSGVVVYPREYFENLVNTAGENIVLLMARSAEGECVGGLMIFRHRDCVYSGYLGYASEYQSLRVVDALFYAAISWARASDARWFMFGTDSPRQDSLIRYKRKWLAVTEEVWSWHWTRRGGAHSCRDTEGPGYRILRGVLRRLPMPMFRAASKLSLSYWE